MRSTHTRSILRTLAWLLISFVLGACGTLDIRIEMPTPAPGSDVTAAPDRDANDSPAEDLPAATPSSYPFEITPTPTPVDYDPWPAEPAFTPVPAGEYPAPSGLRLVFVRDGQIWLWEAGTDEPMALAAMDNPVAGNLKISDDGALVAFLRENGLWVVGSDGTGERQLIGKEELDALSGEDTGLALNRLEWVPGTHTLAFNTRLNLAFGLVLNDDLHLMDADTAEWSTLLTAGEGGEFFFSPDGSQIAVVTPGGISLVDAGGGQREQVLTYTPVNTGSEYRFYARPAWAPDGRTLRVAIPPADPFAQPVQHTSIWHIPTDGSPARMLVSIDAAPLAGTDVIAFSPDLEYLAYAQLRQPEGATPEKAEPWLEVQRLANGDRQAYPHTSNLVRWAPDSQLFAFIAGRHEPRLYIGQWSGATVPGAVDAGTDVFDVRWVDAEHYLFVAKSKAERGPAQDGWDLILADIHGSSTILASMGSYPRYDFALGPSAAPLTGPEQDATPMPTATSLAPEQIPATPTPVTMLPGLPYQANDHSSSPAISADGRYVAFQSGASNLVPDDTNDAGDIFVYDRKTGAVELISLAEDGSQANDASGEPGISADGRWVVFSSIATNLVAKDTNALLDVFLRDRHTGRTILVSAAVGGGTGDMMSMEPVISADGRWIAFTSSADNLIPEVDEHTGEKIADTNGMSDIFVYDRFGGGIRRVNLSTDGKESNHNSRSPGISADGRWVVFWSLADNLVPGASRGIYLHNRSTGTTQWIADGMAPTISPGGHWIGFLPVSSDRVPDDPLFAAVYERQRGEITVIGGYAQGGIQGWPSKALAFAMNGEWLAFQSTFNPPDEPGAAGSGEWGQQVWLRDQKTGMLSLVSATLDGLPGNGISAAPSLSTDGRWIAFQSFADNLIVGDENGYIDIFVYERETGSIELVTFAAHPEEAKQ